MAASQQIVPGQVPTAVVSLLNLNYTYNTNVRYRRNVESGML